MGIFKNVYLNGYLKSSVFKIFKSFKKFKDFSPINEFNHYPSKFCLCAYVCVRVLVCIFNDTSRCKSLTHNTHTRILD